MVLSFGCLDTFGNGCLMWCQFALFLFTWINDLNWLAFYLFVNLLLRFDLLLILYLCLCSLRRDFYVLLVLYDLLVCLCCDVTFDFELFGFG